MEVKFVCNVKKAGAGKNSLKVAFAADPRFEFGKPAIHPEQGFSSFEAQARYRDLSSNIENIEAQIEELEGKRKIAQNAINELLQTEFGDLGAQTFINSSNSIGVYKRVM